MQNNRAVVIALKAQKPGKSILVAMQLDSKAFTDLSEEKAKRVMQAAIEAAQRELEA